MVEARLPGTGFGNDCDELPAPTHGEFERVMHLLQFALASDELRQSAPRSYVKMEHIKLGSREREVTLLLDPRAEFTMTQLSFSDEQRATHIDGIRRTPALSLIHNMVEREDLFTHKRGTLIKCELGKLPLTTLNTNSIKRLRYGLKQIFQLSLFHIGFIH